MNKMNVRFAGVGGAFASRSLWNNLPLLELENHDRKFRIAIDYGSDARHALAGIGLSADDVDLVYVSHLHADHIGGLEQLGQIRYFRKEPKPPYLVVPEHLVRPLWESLKGGMRATDQGPTTLDDYFIVRPIKEDCNFRPVSEIEDLFDIQFRIREVPHVCWVNDAHNGTSNALLVETSVGSVLFTTDCRFCPSYIDDLYELADLIVHDGTLLDPPGVHTGINELATLPDRIKSKIVVSHHNGAVDLEETVKKAGLKGIAHVGDVFRVRSEN